MIGCEGKHLVGQTASTAQEQMLTELAGCLVFMLSPAFGKKKKKKKNLIPPLLYSLCFLYTARIITC